MREYARGSVPAQDLRAGHTVSPYIRSRPSSRTTEPSSQSAPDSDDIQHEAVNKQGGALVRGNIGDATFQVPPGPESTVAGDTNEYPLQSEVARAVQMARAEVATVRRDRCEFSRSEDAGSSRRIGSHASNRQSKSPSVQQSVNRQSTVSPSVNSTVSPSVSPHSKSNSSPNRQSISHPICQSNSQSINHSIRQSDQIRSPRSQQDAEVQQSKSNAIEGGRETRSVQKWCEMILCGQSCNLQSKRVASHSGQILLLESRRSRLDQRAGT
uniref:Uncharacterized protein n=1 Tax=Knipowitschia caucasica TaxID=637954 RepID=A0AAV2KR09_KNICA